MSAIQITSAKNIHIKEAVKLRRRRYRAKYGLCLLEGIRLIRDAISSGINPATLFYVPEWLEGNPKGLALLNQLQQTTECLACSPNVFASLAETKTPQGMIAVTLIPRIPLPSSPQFSLILDQVRDPGNAGTLLRSAEAVGIDHILFGPNTVDPYNSKVLRAGMGAHFRMSLSVCDQWQDITSILDTEQKLYIAEVGVAEHYDQVDWSQPSALIVGGEADGASLNAKLMATPVTIPMLGKTESLNAAVAGSVILFEAARQRRMRKDAKVSKLRN